MSIMFLFLFLFFSTVENVKSARILCVFPATSISHQIFFQPIWRELSLRGHQVTVLTPNPLNDPSLTNLREIDLSHSYELFQRLNFQNDFSHPPNKLKMVPLFYYFYSLIVKSELTNPEVQKLIADKNEHFDLLIVQYNLPTMHALSERFNCPMIGMSVSPLYFIGPEIIGNTPHLALNPDVQLKYRENLNLANRIESLIFTMWHRYYYHNYVVPGETEVAKNLILKDVSYLSGTSSKVSMLFLNANSFTYTIRPKVPTMIDANLYRKNNRSLPIDLQEELDEARNGFIYFSLGSNVRSTNISVALRNTILSAFAELPYKFLWKWEDDLLPGKPRNVLIRKWFPQADILAHPNIKAFFMQGGVQSIEEAIVYNVPLISLPIFLDQFSNTDKIVNLGICKLIEGHSSKSFIKDVIIEVAENPVYKKRITQIANFISDTPLNGLNKTVWWIEYVLRYKGAHFLKSAVLDVAWYQESLLDVIGCGIALISLFIIILYKFYTVIF